LDSLNEVSVITDGKVEHVTTLRTEGNKFIFFLKNRKHIKTLDKRERVYIFLDIMPNTNGPELAQFLSGPF
jgi:hypothetical protein